MTWIWISTIVVLMGAEINAEMEHQTARHDRGAIPTARAAGRWPTTSEPLS
jgi:membrane protein